MANGFFLGGMAEGAMGAQKQALAERTQTEDVGLRSRGLDLQGRQVDLQERQFGHTVSQQAQAQADARIAETMTIIGETIKSGLEGGADPEKIRQTVTPLLQSVLPIAQRAGRNPAALAAQIDAQLTAPTPEARAAVSGRSAGIKTVEQERAIQQQPPGTAVEISPWKTPAEKIKAEGDLRKNYEDQSKNFVTVRNFYDRMQGATDTGPGDITRIFAFMKVQDPESAVREKEYATAENASGVPEAIRNLYNKLLQGDKLSSTARAQIMAEADQIWSGALSRHSSITTQFTNIAKRARLNPHNVIIDYTAGSEKPLMSGTTSFGDRWNLRKP